MSDERIYLGITMISLRCKQTVAQLEPGAPTSTGLVLIVVIEGLLAFAELHPLLFEILFHLVKQMQGNLGEAQNEISFLAV